MKGLRMLAYLLVIGLMLADVVLSVRGDGPTGTKCFLAAIVIWLVFCLPGFLRRAFSGDFRGALGPFVRVLCFLGIHEWSYNGRCYDCNRRSRG